MKRISKINELQRALIKEDNCTWFEELPECNCRKLIEVIQCVLKWDSIENKGMSKVCRGMLEMALRGFK